MRLSFDLTARFGEFQLAAKADFDLSAVTALFGPSGAGKTTILQALAGFRPRLGRIEVDGAVWQDGTRMIPPHKRPVGLVFQDGRLFEHLSVAGNLRYADRRANSGPAIGFDDVVTALDIGALLERKPATLSGGEKQRAAIARALLTRPKLMLMDEPLVALDRRRKAAILPMIADLPRHFGVPVLFVSHQVEEIAQIADRLIAVREGEIIGHGALPDMLDTLDAHMTGHFEAGAIVEGRVVAHDDGFAMTAIEVGGSTLWMPGVGSATGDRVRVRLRARDVSLSLAPVADVSIRNQLPVRIVSIAEEPGAHAEVRLDCGGQTILARITRMAAKDLGLAPGKPAYALIKSVAFDRRLG